MGQIDEARFATSVDGGLATRLGVTVQQPLINPARDAQREQLRLSADMGDTAWHGAQAELMLRTAERYLALALADERVRVLGGQVQALERARRGARPLSHRLLAHHRHLRGRRRPGRRARAAVGRRAGGGHPPPGPGRQHRPGRAHRWAADGALPPAGGAPDWEQAAQADNPRLRMLTQAVAVAEQKLRQQGAAGRPTLDLVAQAGQDRIAGSGDFGSARNRSLNAMVGVQLNIPLYAGGMVQAQEREAAERLNKARAELDAAREDVSQQVRAAWQGLQAGSLRIAALQDALKAGTARLDATRLGREVGDRTVMDMLNAENDHAQAQLALAQARSDQALTFLRLAALADRLDEGRLAQVNATLGEPVSKP
jgi:outer membrane protein